VKGGRLKKGCMTLMEGLAPLMHPIWPNLRHTPLLVLLGPIKVLIGPLKSYFGLILDLRKEKLHLLPICVRRKRSWRVGK
jgi:hypothetical protein